MSFQNKLPLAGLNVVDFSNYVAGPSASKIMADWGAEVVKVERFEGDPWRWFGMNYGLPTKPDENPIFDVESLNKKLIALNLKTDQGMHIMHDLLSHADVFITNFRIVALKKLKLSYDDLTPLYPKLIYGHITAAGDYGPDAEKPGFDVVDYWARTGALIDLVPAEASVPLISPFGFGDHPTGMSLTAGICAALLRKGKTGYGDRVTVSLLGSAIFAVGSMIVSAQPKYGDVFPRSGRLPSSALAHSYKCKDGRWIMLCVLEYERYWPMICKKVFDKQHLAEDERFKTAEVAKQNNAAHFEIIEKEFMTKNSDEWVKLLKAADVAFGKIEKFINVPKDEQAWKNDYLFNHTFKNGNTAVMTRTPVQFASFTNWNPGPETRIGGHTKEVLSKLGYSEAEIVQMEKQNIVKCA